MYVASEAGMHEYICILTGFVGGMTLCHRLRVSKLGRVSGCKRKKYNESYYGVIHRRRFQGPFIWYILRVGYEGSGAGWLALSSAFNIIADEEKRKGENDGPTSRGEYTRFGLSPAFFIASGRTLCRLDVDGDGNDVSRIKNR